MRCWSRYSLKANRPESSPSKSEATCVWNRRRDFVEQAGQICSTRMSLNAAMTDSDAANPAAPSRPARRCPSHSSARRARSR
jgi:hypothetical protein